MDAVLGSNACTNTYAQAAMVPIPLESVIRSNQADIFDLPELPTPLNRSLLIRLLEFYLVVPSLSSICMFLREN